MAKGPRKIVMRKVSHEAPWEMTEDKVEGRKDGCTFSGVLKSDNSGSQSKIIK